MPDKFAVPAGFKLVPLKPTDDMLDAALAIHESRDGEDAEFFAEFTRTYKAMLGAAPRVSADKLFDKLQSPFGYDRAMRDRDVHTLANALIDAGIEAILSDDAPLTPRDEPNIAMVKKAMEMIDKAEANIRADYHAGKISKEQFQKELLIVASARQQAPAPPEEGGSR